LKNSVISTQFLWWTALISLS